MSKHVEKRISRATAYAQRLAEELLAESDDTPKLEIIVKWKRPGFSGLQEEHWFFEPVGSSWRKNIGLAIRRVGSNFVSWHIQPIKKALSIEERDRILDEMEAEESAQ